MKNWKTTLCGGMIAAGSGLMQSDEPTLKAIGQILSVVGPLLLGLLAKDLNVTRGTK